MPDREKVIYDIERCVCHVPDACRDCSHYQDDPELDCMEKLLADALVLLKEQEAVEPKVEKAILDYQSWHYICGDCGGQIDINDNYCRHCGRVVAHLSNKI